MYSYARPWPWPVLAFRESPAAGARQLARFPRSRPLPRPFRSLSEWSGRGKMMGGDVSLSLLWPPVDLSAVASGVAGLGPTSAQDQDRLHEPLQAFVIWSPTCTPPKNGSIERALTCCSLATLLCPYPPCSSVCRKAGKRDGEVRPGQAS